MVNLAQLADFDEIIDVRSESEFADDHVPGATNYPVLNDEERVRVGTLYKQVSAFDAKKLGAALVSRNIANHLEATFAQRPRAWCPLVYCWRGGTRSAALTHVLQQVGWRARRLDGGYKTYRRTVLSELEILPHVLDLRIICGLTGAGKSRFLRALALLGAQVLDLEALAAHRGSVLGNLPDEPQPAQKMFESLVWSELRRFDRSAPIFVEAESKKIGNIRVPQSLIAQMRESPSLKLEAGIELRVAMLKDDYQHFIADAGALGTQLDCLTAHYGKQQIGDWKRLASLGEWDRLVSELLEKHYDPAYTRSTLKNFPHLVKGAPLVVTENDDREFERLAQQCLRTLAPRAHHR